MKKPKKHSFQKTANKMSNGHDDADYKKLFSGNHSFEGEISDIESNGSDDNSPSSEEDLFSSNNRLVRFSKKSSSCLLSMIHFLLHFKKVDKSLLSSMLRRDMKIRFYMQGRRK